MSLARPDATLVDQPERVSGSAAGARRAVTDVMWCDVRHGSTAPASNRVGRVTAPTIPAVPSNPPSPTVERAGRVVVVMAMEAEAAPLREALGAEPVDKPEWAGRLPCRISVAAATAGRPAVVLAVNGLDPMSGVDSIGTTAAALTTNVALNLPGRPEPDLVMSVGTAGGWRRHGASVGDAYVAWPRVVCHDRRIALPGFDALGEGNLPTADLRDHAAALGCRLGIVTSGDSLDESAEDRARIRASGAEVKEMEAAAVSWVAHLHAIPVTAVKTITDLVDSPVATEAQFTENLHTAAESLQATTLALLDRLGGSR